MHWPWGGWWSGGWMMVLGGIYSLLVLVAVILAIVWLVQAAGRPRPAPPAAPHPPAEDAVAVARLRYARGELTRDQYLQLMADLGHPVTPEPPATPPA